MRKARWLLVAVLAATIAGCGDDAPDPVAEEGLSKAALSEQANAICTKYADEGRALGQPDLTDPAAATEYFGAAEELARRQQAELETLEPATALESDYDRLVAANAKATTVLADLAATSPEDEQFVGLVQGLEPLRAEVDDAARAVGADQCAG